MERITVVKSEKEVPLVAFANGVFKKESRKRKLKLQAFKDSKNRAKGGKKRKMMIAESDKMVYRGDNFGPLSVHNQPTQLYVAELDKKTGKMTMYPAEIFNMHPVTETRLQGEQADVGSMSMKEKSDLLVDAFGSGKQKRALEKRHKNKMSEGTVDSAMGSAVDSAKATQQLQPPPLAQHESSAIPPCNTEAKQPADVYNLNDIISPAILDSLKNAAQEICKCDAEKIKEWREEKKFYSCVLSRLSCLSVMEERRLEQACLLLYLQYMVTLYLCKRDQLRKKVPLPSDWPDILKQMMLERFCLKLDRGQRCMPARLKDLLLSHIMVLILIFDGFKSPLAPLQQDLKISAKRLQMHARALGCKVKSESVTTVTGVTLKTFTAMLQIPLSFPEPTKKKNKR